MKFKKAIFTAAGAAVIGTLTTGASVFADDLNPIGEGVNLLHVENWSELAVTDVDTYVNIRNRADLSGEQVGVLLPGCVVITEGTEGDWTKIRSGNVEGYIRSDLLVTDAEAQEIFLDSYDVTGTVDAYALNVRSEASRESELIGIYAEGDEVTLKSYEDGWYAISYNGKDAYVAADYIVTNATEHTAMTLEEYEAYQNGENISASESEDDSADAVENVSATVGAEGISDEDLKLLAAIIHCEAGGEIETGKIAVGAVVMNRVNSASFPNTIREVVYQSGQFTPAMTGWLDSVLAGEVDEDCYAAALAALSGEDPTGGCLYFHAGGGNGLTIGNQTFYNL